MPGLSARFQKKKWAKLDRISITPSAYLLLGNDIYSEIRYPYSLRETIFRYNHNLPWYQIIDNNVFGVMNYSFSAPLNIIKKNWSLTLTYTRTAFLKPFPAKSYVFRIQFHLRKPFVRHRPQAEKIKFVKLQGLDILRDPKL